MHCKSFVKTEEYGEFKYPRAINSRSDVFKCLVGPFVQEVESIVFQCVEFIKHVPVDQRPAYIRDMLYRAGAKYYATDFSSFEALFTPEVIRCCELQLYKYMAGRNVEALQAFEWLRRALPGRNSCHFRTTTVQVGGVRMSGDMCTSLGNGFTNLMVISYLCWLNGATFDGVVEGDDGLFRIDGRAPTSDQYKALGFSIKMVESFDVGKAGFCTEYFDVEEAVNVPDPVDALVKTGWSHSFLRGGGPEVRRALLRAKADSLMSMYAGAPVVQELAQACYRIAGAGKRLYQAGPEPDYWERLTCDPKPVKPVSDSSRAVCQAVFGLTCEEQKSIERQLQNISSPGFYRFPEIERFIHPHWRMMWRMFVKFEDRNA